MVDCLKRPETRDAKRSGCPVHLVLEHDPLVAADLSQILGRTGPCRVVAARSVEEAHTVLVDVPVLTFAFLEMDCTTYLGSDLDEALRLRGGVPIFTRGEGNDAPIRARGWARVSRPFSEEMVLDAILSVQRQP